MLIFQKDSLIISLGAMNFTILMLPAGRSGRHIFIGENLILCFRFALFWTQKGEEAHRDSAVSRFGIYQMRFPNCVDLHIEK